MHAQLETEPQTICLIDFFSKLNGVRSAGTAMMPMISPILFPTSVDGFPNSPEKLGRGLLFVGAVLIDKLLAAGLHVHADDLVMVHQHSHAPLRVNIVL
jgi:hypothetical protein